MNIADLRKEYSARELSEREVDPSPFRQFQAWFQEAIATELLEPNAMVLSTVSQDSKPSQRTVLLKSYDEEGFVFFTNFGSRKAMEIGKNASVSLLFPWYGLERQLIVNGQASKVPTQQSLNYFLSRPYGSQLGAWVSQQSQVITSRSILEQKLAQIKAKFKEGKVPLPDFWGGFRVVPETFEFWQGRPNRLHDRIQYSLQGDRSWKISRLAP